MPTWINKGLGTALKPASEHWILARKPLDGTIAANVLAHGTGAINVDACRVQTDEGLNGGTYANHPPRSGTGIALRTSLKNGIDRDFQQPSGRWPPNLVLTHSASCSEGGACAAGCPVRVLDEQSGHLASGVMRAGTTRSVCYGDMPDTATLADTPGDEGGASRFFPRFYYCAKADRMQREAGCEAIEAKQRQEVWGAGLNTATKLDPTAGHTAESVAARPMRANGHPTVKPIALMQWLVRLITPPGGTVLDPFAGSGTTGVACMREGFNFVGVEREAEYVEIARRRIALAEQAPRADLKTRAVPNKRQQDLFK